MNPLILSSQPWRFMPGDQVYIRNQKQQPAIVLAQLETSYVWPHYMVQDFDRRVWRVSQLELSSKPIVDR